jgi:hypothetical protein
MMKLIRIKFKHVRRGEAFVHKGQAWIKGHSAAEEKPHNAYYGTDMRYEFFKANTIVEVEKEN